MTFHVDTKNVTAFESTKLSFNSDWYLKEAQNGHPKDIVIIFHVYGSRSGGKFWEHRVFVSRPFVFPKAIIRSGKSFRLEQNSVWILRRDAGIKGRGLGCELNWNPIIERLQPIDPSREKGAWKSFCFLVFYSVYSMFTWAPFLGSVSPKSITLSKQDVIYRLTQDKKVNTSHITYVTALCEPFPAFSSCLYNHDLEANELELGL